MHIDPAIVRELAPTGTLRAALNMGNPVLAHSRTQAERPAGVTIDLARTLAGLMGVPLQLIEFATPGESGAAVAAGVADIGFLAIDPKRAETLHFTAPYVRIEGCYLVRDGSPLRSADDVDRAGTRIVVGQASAYALHLARHLQHAQLVEVQKSEGVVDAFAADPRLDAAAGVRQQLETDARRVPGMRLLPGAFMVIEQAMMTARTHSDAARACLDAFMATQRREGRVADALARHGIEGASVVP